MRHLHNRLFRRGEVVAQIDQRGADIAKLALAGTHDVGKLRNGRRGVAGVQVFTGIAQVDHDARKIRQMLGSNAQLTARRHDLVDLVRTRRNFGRHFLRRSCQLIELRLRRVHGLSDGGKRRFKIDGGLGGQTGRGRLEILHARGGQPERRLRFLDLLIDGFDIAGKIIAVQ